MGGVGNLRTVWGEKGPRHDGAHRGKPLGLAAVAADRPDVVRVAEGDLVLAQGRAAQQQRRRGGRGLGGSQNGEKHSKSKQG